jgi:hypothetical protein
MSKRKLYAVDLKLCATAYIKARNSAEAMSIAKSLANQSPSLLDSEGDIPVSGLQYRDPALPDVSLSPAMTIHGVWEGGTFELMEHGI